MENYPGELLVGVFPLVFCVDATLEKSQEKNRSQFDKLLDTIAASSSSLDATGDIHEGGPVMQRVEEEQSDREDDLLLNQMGVGSGGSDFPTHRRRSSRSSSIGSVGGECPESPNSRQGQRKNRKGPFLGTRSPFSKRMTPNPGAKGTQKKRSSSGTQRRGSDGTAEGDSPEDFGINVLPAFAEALQQGQSFFQRARVVSSSPRHGFPPSKDPTGASNRVVAITRLKSGQQPPSMRILTPLQQKQTVKRAVACLKSATQARPIDGILPSGWLEKHAAALPSVIVVVTQIHPPNQEIQKRQDDLLLEALQNLQYSLAPKRKVDVKVVAIVQEGVSPINADQWSQGMLGKLQSYQENSKDNESILTMVDAFELRSIKDGESSPVNPKTSYLPRLYQSIRRSSLRYYKDRSREVKGKLLRLRGPNGATIRSPVLMPLLIRYCFKAAIFYEFQWKQTKSLKYMVEAYRLVETYYNYLLFWKHQREIGAYSDEDTAPQSEEMSLSETTKEELQIPVLSETDQSEEATDGGEGVEMSLNGSTASTAPSTNVSLGEEYLAVAEPPVVAEDMILQCRALADWLNFKILQMCLVSHDKSGMIAASVQWQRHAKTFCCPRRSFLRMPSAPWLDWSYVAQQRVVISQLLERNPPRALGDISGGDSDEDLLRCCPWKTYEAAADALLRVGHSVRTVVQKGGLTSLPPGKEPPEGANRIRYVGAIDHEGFRPSYMDESQKSHTEKALHCALRGISLFGTECQRAESSQTLVPWRRTGARLHYLAGGALLSLNRRPEAIPHLEKAAKLCKGWKYLESAVRRLLIECYQHTEEFDIVGPVKDEDGSRRVRTSFLLESYFGASLTANELTMALEKLLGTSGVDIGGDEDRFLRWHCNFVDSEMVAGSTPPFSFEIAFPTSTHGSVGDKVKVTVWLKSNLDYAVRIKQMSVLSFLGPLSVPSKDFPSNESEAVITILPHETIQFATELTIPKDLTQSTGNGAGGADGESKVVPGNAARNVISRPRSGGFTAAGGSRYSIDDDSGNKSSEAIPWSLRCLGGKTLRCEGITVMFSIVADSARNAFVSLTIEAKQPEPQPNTRRTATFDDNNYLSSSWTRPLSLPMVRGPRCMRILSPIANMTVKNITEEFTNGKALEGTVNRIVLKLKAAENETYANVRIRTTCSSVLTTIDGKAKPIAICDGDSNVESEDVEDMMNPRVRSPVLVKPDPSSKTFMTDFGYILPTGWSLAGNGQGGEDGYDIVAPTMKAGEDIYTFFDVYRPPSEPLGAYTRGNQEIAAEMKKINECKCETKITLSILYEQESTDGGNAGSNDAVALDHSIDLEWSPPISITFNAKVKDAYPSGNRHPSNFVTDHSSPKNQPPSDPEKNIIVIDDGRVFTKGVLDPIASTDGHKIEIDKVQFTDTESESTKCKFKLLNGLDNEGTIFQGSPDQMLRTGSRLSIAWITDVGMDLEYREESLIAPLGIISVHWRPSRVELSESVNLIRKDSFATSHGPLQLERPAICRFSGPLCHIESAPFEVTPGCLPDSVKIATPFEVTYSIRNKTPVDQELELLLQESRSTGDESNDGFLIGGLANKVTSLGPFESHSFSYTTVPMKVGKVDLPPVSISSKRYNTWVVRESVERRPIYVLP